MTAAPPALRTTSLRLRTVVAIVVLLAVLLGGLCVAVQVLLGDQLRAQTVDRLRDRASAAAALVGTVDADDLADRLSMQGLSVRIVQPDGAEVQAGPSPEQLRAGPPDPGSLPAPGSGPGAAAGGTGTGTGTGRTTTGSADGASVVSSTTSEDDGVLTLRSRLDDGTVLTLTTGTRDVQSTLSTLGWVMGAASAGFLVVAVVGVTLVVRRALRPLDVVTSTAMSIAGGDRGRRLRPHRNDTEIGRVATALDTMLDAVEGAEDSAVQAELRLRAFLSDAAHELRTPVAGVRAAAETLIRAGVQGGQQEQLAVHVVRQAGRASRLVDDMLTMARLDRGIELDRRPVDLAAFLTAEAERLVLRLPSVRLDVRVPDHPVPALLDADRIAQVLGNLADNAARATGGDGHLLLTLLAAAGADTAVVRLEDDGVGIPLADRERVFDRLVRLDDGREDRSGGAGLGLPIARGIARASGGELVAADPLVLDGAAFVLTLPVSGSGSPVPDHGREARLTPVG
ncbi:HAMP domain-containing sensor histidine kinase [Curtobacterium herbarum]|uniref:HAMP domain-containing sensor histidine kinase n=1 Tax=Curtobacterium herbarum TaxID=150122 RepID=UPI001958F992|nr:HAMP domain-containing sensor histidine kinase [Curtobacterium herbarum]MBM7474599.1 signal transduction histidine kinase [Curtobacterium herbarum]MCS6545254.1 HAMP domain-containing histidine kinase [Curtobacterium herbarum]